MDSKKKKTNHISIQNTLLMCCDLSPIMFLNFFKFWMGFLVFLNCLNILIFKF